MSHRLIFVEDDKAQSSLFRDALSEWNNRNPELKFTLETADTFDTAVMLLADSRFDGALLDLRLPGGSGKLPGADLASLCLSQYGIPAGIISGNPRDYDKSQSNGMLEIFDKLDGNAYEKAIAWFASLWHMMKIVSGARRQIQKLGASVFSKQVWPRWSAYEALAGISDEQLVGIVSRQYASHIADVLAIDSEGAFQWHPFENYIQPALLESRPHTGDVFRMDGKLWIVLTPQCDMATSKAKSVLLACCEPRPEINEWQAQIIELSSAVAGRKRSAEQYFRKLITQAEPALHFLPPLEGGQPLMVDFKSLTIVELTELQKRLIDRVASLATPFLPNLTQRFGAYVSRIGQPNIDIGHLR